MQRWNDEVNSRSGREQGSYHFFSHCCFMRSIRSSKLSFDIREFKRSTRSGKAKGEGRLVCFQ